MWLSLLSDPRGPEEIWLSSVESRLLDVADGKATLTLPEFKDIMQVKEVRFHN